MYNLTVDTAHTFFVGEGQWLVHNDVCPINMKNIDWSDYPSHRVPKPNGQLQFLDGDDYDLARDLANTLNQELHQRFPKKFKDVQIHEIQPVKFGGSPSDINNKVALLPKNHYVVKTWWYRLQRRIENNPEHYLLPK